MSQITAVEKSILKGNSHANIHRPCSPGPISNVSGTLNQAELPHKGNKRRHQQKKSDVDSHISFILSFFFFLTKWILCFLVYYQLHKYQDHLKMVTISLSKNQSHFTKLNKVMVRKWDWILICPWMCHTMQPDLEGAEVVISCYPEQVKAKFINILLGWYMWTYKAQNGYIFWDDVSFL